MLKLKDIKKNYVTDFATVEALKGVSLEFRHNEFVAILGPSGCGKTTMLNVIGGLDQYTTGDLIINGRSTKDFKDKDWDSYRNHSIGFVFQNYNLIPHQTILENVEIALTLSGVSKAERKKRATEVLGKVGLEDKLNVRPNQLSGGQMQRVAIARALVNNPEILLADEPTGALDSKTSIQILELLKEISKDKLIIMVTHNAELAYSYSNRIIKLMDGLVVDDSNPYTSTEIIVKEDKDIIEKKTKKDKNKRTSMSFITALSLSLNNLLTKKARTILVAFAGSIGIIGIALILSLSNGFQLYINKVQEDTLSTYPLVIEDNTINMNSLLESISNEKSDEEEHDMDKVYSSTVMIEMFQTMMAEQHKNNLKDFKSYLESDESKINDYVSDIKYGYNLDLNIYSSSTAKGNVQVNPSTIFADMFSNSSEASMYAQYAQQITVFSEMINNQKLLDSQYQILDGHWPTSFDEVVIVCNKNNEINDYMLYALGIKDVSELKVIMDKLMKGEEVEIGKSFYTYKQLLSLTFKLVLNSDYYSKNGNVWTDNTENEDYITKLIKNGLELKVVGVIKPKDEAAAQSINGVIGYTSDLTKYVINNINNSEIAKEQVTNPEIDVFTGKKFEKVEITIDLINQYITMLPQTQQEMFNNQMQMYRDQYGEEEANNKIITMFDSYLNTSNTYEKNLLKIGINDLSNPATISLYPVDFASKDMIIEVINNYNKQQVNAPENEIQYTDYIGILMSSISDVINAVTYVLVAFVAISLIVSSIMIGIITYISVLERIKEIGILRSVGASKKDISNVFNAETLIIGFISGTLGILITVILDIPINIIIDSLANIGHVAKLPVIGAILLIVVSMVLSLVAGLIPSSIAAKKDPVEALRSE